MNKLFKFLIGVTFLSLTLTACSNASSDDNSGGTTDNPSSETHEHTYSSSWTYDSTYHWHESTCGHDVVSGKAEHTFKDKVTSATYESGGYTTHTCTVCGYSYIDNQTNKLTHNYSTEWSHDEHSHWHACTDSGYENLKNDEEGHCFQDKVTPATYESGGYTTHTCTICSYSYIDNQTSKLTHNYSTEWSHDENSHWHACTDSGYENLKKDEEGHRFTEQVVTPTGLEEGYTIHTCGECGYSYRDNYQEKLTYTITWKNYDGSVLETDTNVAYSSMPSFDGATPTRTSDAEYSYTFSGWSPSITSVTGDTTYTALYSQTKIGVKLTIVYSLYNPKTNKIIESCTNMPSDMGNVSVSQTYNFNTNVDLFAEPNEGYVFIGWYYDGLILSSEPNYKYMMWDEDITLEARFKYATYSLHVFANHDENGLIMIKNGTYSTYVSEDTTNQYYTESVTIAAYTKNDTRFLGWYDEDNQLISTNAVYTFTMSNRDRNIEAKWNYFTVSYNLNGGTNNDSNPKSYTIDYNDITLYEPTRTGYDFTGWTYNGRVVTEIDPAWIENVTIVANWGAHSYSISYELNGGTNNSSNPTSYTIENSTITLRDATRNGYTFSGWYKTSTFSNLVTTINTGSYGDLVLYAKWTPVQYSITYNLDGGTNASSNPLTYTIESAFNFSDATKTGYRFAGWFDDNGNRVTSILAGATGALTLTAHWAAKLNKLSVTSEDTSKGTVAITSGSGYSNESITVVATPVGDYLFKGWYRNSTKVSNDATYTFVMPTNDLLLVAHFFTKAEAEVEEMRNLGCIPTLSDDRKTITYGLYPQKNVNNSSLVTALNELTTPESNGWYLYEGDYYAKVSASPYETSYKFDNGTKITSGATYWFKCEPIVWKVLSKDNGEYYIISSVLLDAHGYYNSTSERTIDDQTVYANNYKYSDIRTWLNEDFYNSAFALENSHIQTTTVDNSASTTDSTSNIYACDNTEDKVFLPSYQDYINSSYGFSGYGSGRCKTTDWARARGSYCETDSSYHLNNGFYWTRSPDSKYSEFASFFLASGNLSSCYVTFTGRSVRPAITLKIA
ncbi:MAG: InlB B-repeat-containing protein [Bacilli bacterium]|nr:InlB B-repeat-containing protein [Bacilli bacterium]